MQTLRADFDKIALLSDDTRWDHNNHYHRFLLKQLPIRCTNILDIGCGTGGFSRLLAQRCDQVVAIDLSSNMIKVAKERSSNSPNIDYQVADIMETAFPMEHFDCISSLATLHHLPMETVLVKIRNMLKSGGTLIVLDLFHGKGVSSILSSALALPISRLFDLMRNGPLKKTPELKAAFEEHGKHDSYLTLAQVRQYCRDILPGAVVRQHLLWRYSITWKKT